MVALRPYQSVAIASLRSSLARGKRKPILQLPTGAGKTIIAGEIIRMARDKDNKVAFVVPSISLIDQTVAAFRDIGITEVGVIQADHELTDYSQPIQVCSIQTIGRRAAPKVPLVIVDEVHNQYKAIHKWMDRDPEAIFVGLSATPWTKGLAEHWDDLIIASTTRQLIDQGYLCDYVLYAPSSPDLSGVKIVAGDYHEGELSEVMRDHALVGDIVQNWMDLSTQEKTLVFAVDRAHAKALVQEFETCGVPMGYCDAHVDRVMRKVLFDRMQSGEIKGIVNIGTLTTGVDADVRNLVLARPTKSQSLFVQIIGRALRTAPGKDRAIIIDHSDTALRLGLPCRISKGLSNAKRDQRSGDAQEKPEPLPKPCPKCQKLKQPNIRVCPSCGFEAEFIREVECADGQLAIVDPRTGDVSYPEAKPKSQREVLERMGKQNVYAMLKTIQMDRGRKRTWVDVTYKKIFGDWPAGFPKACEPILPSPAVVNFVKHQDIAYAKRRQAGQKQEMVVLAGEAVKARAAQ